MIYPLFRRVARRTGLYLTTKAGGGSQSYPTYQLSEGDTNGNGYSKRKKFRHPLSIPADTQWNTISDEQMILPTSRQQPPTCIGSGDGDWDSQSHTSHGAGIKVIHETIVHSVEKDPRS